MFNETSRIKFIQYWVSILKKKLYKTKTYNLICSCEYHKLEYLTHLFNKFISKWPSLKLNF